MLIAQITDHGSSGFTGESFIDGSAFHLYGGKLTPFQSSSRLSDKHILLLAETVDRAAPGNLAGDLPGISKI